jgi:hypothetical protein
MSIVIKVESDVIVWKVSIAKVEKFNDLVKFISIYIFEFRLSEKYIFIFRRTQWMLHSKQVHVALSAKYAGVGQEVPQADWYK